MRPFAAGRQGALHTVGLACLVSLVLTFASAQPMRAQPAPLTIVIASPGEGETLYAGPSVPLYSIPITGWVISPDQRLAGIALQLQVFQGSALIGQLAGAPTSDGLFRFNVAVNGDTGKGFDNYGTGLTKLNNSCGLGCHYRASLDLPRGATLLRVTATTRAGQQVSTDRHIVVDRAGYASVPVQIKLEGTSAGTLAGIPVEASARLYLWRARHTSAQSDEHGTALVTVEALAQAPTHYVFTVEPTILDGVRYESTAPVSVDLPPGAASAPVVTLNVRASLGQMSGTVTGSRAAPLTVWAVHLPEGRAVTTQGAGDGTFAFHDLPLGAYWLTGQPPPGYQLAGQPVDLTQSTEASATLALAPSDGPSLELIARAEDGNPLPFAWVTVEQLGQTRRVAPDTGSLTLTGLPAKPLTLLISAPGHYSRAVVLDPAQADGRLDVVLARRPDARLWPAGAGQIEIPPETQGEFAAGSLALERGWIWGHEAGGVTIRIGSAVIMASGANFALEAEPGAPAWLYVFKGSVQVQVPGPAASLDAASGQMVALDTGSTLRAAPLNALVFEATHRDFTAPLSPVWQPTLASEVRDGLARAGIGAAQVMTFITYFLVSIAVVMGPLWGLQWWLRRRAAGGKPPPGPRETV